MSILKSNEITKSDFLKLQEENVMFITNPGRMGDEDGITFVVKEENHYKKYRVNGWMYPTKGVKEEEYISFEDALKQFPKWQEAWENCNDKNYHGKYNYIYMGFGNGLCVDHSIYSEYEPYLNNLVEKFLDNSKDKESLQYAAIYNVWEEALNEMIETKIKN